jgi:hypothetical protein
VLILDSGAYTIPIIHPPLVHSSCPLKLLRRCVGKFALCLLYPTELLNVKLAGLLLRPRFVKIWITPPEASEPYSVEAAGPLSTSTRSISSGFKSDSLSSPAPPENAQQVVDPPAA